MKNEINKLFNQSPNLFIKKTFKKGDTLFQENDICHFVGFVVEGRIKISSYTIYGNEVIYSIINKNEFFGNNLIFSSTPKYKGNVVSITNSVIYFISKENFLKILMENKAILNGYLLFQAERSKELNSKIKTLSLSDARERFLYYLSINNNIIHYQSISSLASTINLRRETLSRLITTLIDEKVIIKENRCIKKI